MRPMVSGGARVPDTVSARAKGFAEMHIEQFVVEGLGHQSYLVADERSGEAALVDPRRDIDVYLRAAQREGMRITHVLETHLHNDYISGAREVAASTGATIIASALDPLNYPYRSMRDGARFSIC